MSVTPQLETIQFPNQYVYVLVEAGQTREVFKTQMTGDFTGFIERIACDWEEGSNPPATGTILVLDIDGFPRTFQYEIPINNPLVYNPPIVVRKYFRWLITNNDKPYVSNGVQKTGGHYYGILTDGVLSKPKPKKF